MPIAALAEALYGKRTPASHATVQSLLARLEAKGCVRRSRPGRAHLYEATLERSALIDHQLRHLADKLCEGSLTPLLTHLVQARTLKEDERRELRALLAQLEDSGSTPPKKKTSRRHD